MNIEELRTYCLSKPHVTESFPFDASTLVFKVGTKLFALTGLDRLPAAINLKCDPEKALDLRDTYEHILPGYHMNKKHWNTLEFEELPTELLKELIDHSYNLVLKGMTKKAREALN